MAQRDDWQCPPGLPADASGSRIVGYIQRATRGSGDPEAEFFAPRLARDLVEDETLDRIYHLFYEQIYSHLYFQTRDKHLTEDLVSRAFMRAQHFLRRHPRRRIRIVPWLYRIAENELKQHRRYEMRHPTIGDEILDFRASPRPGPDVQLERKEENERVREAVDRLGPRDREIIIMNTWQGLSLRRIGRILELPEGTVKSRVQRARRKLERMLGEDLS
jgi:RNA polymerase sigma-70 factor (ECF subfamily)